MTKPIIDYVFIAGITTAFWITQVIKNTYYIVGVERHDGTQAYLRGFNQSSGTRTVSNNGLTNDPALALFFEEDSEKSDVILWMDTERSKIAKWANTDTLRIMIYESIITPVEISTDAEWRKELQRSAVGKLSVMEIEALKLEKYEIERRLSLD